MKDSILKNLNIFLNLGVAPDDDNETIRKKRLYIPMGTSGVIIGLFIFLVESYFEYYPQAYQPLLLSLLFSFVLVYFVISKNLENTHYVSFGILLIIPLLNQWSLGGFYNAGIVGIWGISAPFGALIFQNVRQAKYQFFIFVIVSVIFLVLERVYPTPWKKIPEEISFYLLLFNFHGFVIFVFFNVSHYVLQKDLVMEALDKEHHKTVEARLLSDKLLLNILPSKIAERLKLKEEYIVDDFQEVSILFADIVGFTKISEMLTPEKLVQILNRIFIEFDSITEKNGLEKIKTIGDAYMAAAGLPELHKEHAIACVRSALEMTDFIKTDPYFHSINLELRIGIHSGEVVAGVIGKNKFAYDLWGDAVNTASRMESHGSPGEIQITNSVKDRLGNQFILEERGQVNIKGKGMIETYFVKGLT